MRISPDVEQRGGRPYSAAMKREVRAALLPLYLDLYDRTMPEVKAECEKIIGLVSRGLEEIGIAITKLPTCRIEAEFKDAIRTAERVDVCAVVTLHLAYSPSLESAGPLAETALPVIVLDTTPAYSFGPGDDSGALMHNHGIHGVQDLCNILTRLRKPYVIEAGHWERSDVLARTASHIRSAFLASVMRRQRAGRIGEPFEGMGDFAVDAEVLRSAVGIETVTAEPADIATLIPAATDPEVVAEIETDRVHFDTSETDPELHVRSVCAGIAVRRWIDRERLTAYALNFLALDAASGFGAVPFLEAGKAMERGIGYAGEGDILTAALVGTLASLYDSTFTEMFCPDWAGGRIFLSHMAEINLRTVAGKPRLIDKRWDFIPLRESVAAVGAMRPGRGTFVDLAPLGGERFRLIVCPASIADTDGPGFRSMIRGWMKPAIPLEDFLEEYSRYGGTHHAVFVYGDTAEEIAGFGRLMGWDTVVVGG